MAWTEWAPGEVEDEHEVLTQNQKSIQALWSLPFTLVFFLVFTVTQWLHRDVSVTYPLTSGLKALMESPISVSTPAVVEEEGLVENVVAALSTSAAPPGSDPQTQEEMGNSSSSNNSSSNSGSGRRLIGAAGGGTAATSSVAVKGKSYDSVMTLSDIMVWLEATPLRLLWKRDSELDGEWGVVLGFNQAVGGCRVRQQRRVKIDCPGLDTLAAASKTGCYEGGDGGGGTIGAAGDAGAHGFVADQDGAYTYWFDVAQDEGETLAHSASLRDRTWLREGAETVLAQMVFYNSQIAFFAAVDVLFIVNQDGSLTRKMAVRSLPTTVYDAWATVIGDICVVFLLICLGVWEAVGLFRTARRGLRAVIRYLKWYRVLNWAVLFFGSGFSIFFVALSARLRDLGKAVGSVPVPASDGENYSPTSISDAWKERHGALDAAYDEVIFLSEALRMCELSTFWYGMLIMAMFFRAFQGHPRLDVITQTMVKSCFDLLWFMFLFLLIFINFVLGAYFIYGHILYEWSSMSLATNTAFRTLMGDFDFAPMYTVAPISAMFWFYSYMCFFYLIMLNMLLAIIMDSYAVVKDEAAERAKQQDELLKEQGRRLTNFMRSASSFRGLSKSFSKSFGKSFSEPTRSTSESRAIVRIESPRASTASMDDDVDVERGDGKLRSAAAVLSSSMSLGDRVEVEAAEESPPPPETARTEPAAAVTRKEAGPPAPPWPRPKPRGGSDHGAGRWGNPAAWGQGGQDPTGVTGGAAVLEMLEGLKTEVRELARKWEASVPSSPAGGVDVDSVAGTSDAAASSARASMAPTTFAGQPAATASSFSLMAVAAARAKAAPAQAGPRQPTPPSVILRDEVEQEQPQEQQQQQQQQQQHQHLLLPLPPQQQLPLQVQLQLDHQEQQQQQQHRPSAVRWASGPQHQGAQAFKNTAADRLQILTAKRAVAERHANGAVLAHYDQEYPQPGSLWQGSVASLKRAWVQGQNTPGSNGSWDV